MQTKYQQIRYGISLFLSLFFVLSPVFLTASEGQEKKELSADEYTIIEQIVTCLSMSPASPFLSDKPSEYYHLSFVKDSDHNNTYAFGLIKQGENSCYSLFSITKPWFGSKHKTDLIYLTDDRPISPVLFWDILTQATVFLNKDPDNYSIFIKRIDDDSLPSITRLQKWIFCTESEKTELSVRLTEDGKGGMYYSVTKID